jgi:hypothetical protein
MEEAKKILDNAIKILKEPFSTTKLEIYWISYSVDRAPREESTYHCEYFSINIPLGSEPGEEGNMAKAVKEFRAKKAPKIKELHKESKSITTLKAHLNLEECQKYVEGENCKQEKVKQHIRTQNLRKPEP